MDWQQTLANANAQTIREALDEHGAAAARGWLLSRGFDPEGLFSPDDTPEDCPFPAHSGEPAEIIRDTFAPLADKLPKLIQRLTDSTRAVFRYDAKGGWVTIYVCVEPEGPVLFGGGSPSDSPAVSDEYEELGWSIPADLASLYGIHDGLGWMDTASSFWWQRTILPAAALMPGTVFTHFGDDLPYNPGHLLMFWSDAAGSFRCLVRQHPDDDQPLTGSWSSVDQELPEQLTPLFSWIDDHIGPGVDG